MLFSDSIKSNVLLYSTAKDVLYHLDPKSRRYEMLTASISEIDCIADFQAFRQEMELFKQKSITMPRVIRYGAETYHYGYYKQLIKYAKCNNDRFVYIPALEHGIRFGKTQWPYVQNSISYACQGPGRKDEIHKVDPWKPIFVLGPYIHYATPYYSLEKEQQIKSELGRVLLIFPCHSWEFGEKMNENNLYDTIYKKYADNYDTVLVCAYWNDIDAPIIELFEKKGAKIVSAGFRNDSSFIRRLKTIISLADDVVTDDIGTNIGFCKYMNKPVYLECFSPREPDDKVYNEYFNCFHEAFYSQNIEFSEKQLKQQEKLYKYFWGGEEYLKTSEEVKDILGVMKEMCIETHYKSNKMPEFIRAHCTGMKIERRYQLLADAVSSSVWQNIK